MSFQVKTEMRVFQVMANPDTYEYAPSPRRAIEQAVEHYGNQIMASVMDFGAPVPITDDQLADIFSYYYRDADPKPRWESDAIVASAPQNSISDHVLNSNSVNRLVCGFPQQTVFHKGGHTERQWEGTFFRCGMRCYYCLKPLMLIAEDIGDRATKDHLTPVSRGGANLISNIVPACIACNQRKGDMTEAEFRKTFSEAFKILTSVPSAETKMLFSQDEPSLLRLRLEGEISGSSAWRTK
jgi:5-methylcytosine-specific restriction endonuclease McrA